MWSWCGVDVELMLSWCGADVEHILSWCGADEELMWIWCGADVELMKSWCWADEELILNWCGADVELMWSRCGADVEPYIEKMGTLEQKWGPKNWKRSPWRPGPSNGDPCGSSKKPPKKRGKEDGGAITASSGQDTIPYGSKPLLWKRNFTFFCTFPLWGWVKAIKVLVCGIHSIWNLSKLVKSIQFISSFFGILFKTFKV